MLRPLSFISKPIDRVAICVVEEYGQPHIHHLVAPLLKDPYPYLQLAAAELLKDTSPH